MITLNNQFTQHQLTNEELLAGYYLSPEQRAVIQNDIAEAAMQKVMLKFDPSNPMEFVQKEAELAGRILILTHMLNRAPIDQENNEDLEL